MSVWTQDQGKDNDADETQVQNITEMTRRLKKKTTR